MKWVDPSDDELLLARYSSLSHRIPAIGFAVMSGMVAQISILKDIVPPLWSVICPSIIFTFGAGSILLWLWQRRSGITVQQARRRAARDTILLISGGALGAFMDIQSLPYLQTGERYFLLVQLILFGIGIFFCTIHLRAAALASATMLLGAGLVVALSIQSPGAIAASVMLLIFSSVVLSVMMEYHNDFTGLINSRANLERLSNENASLAKHDTLTGLPNRRDFFSSLNDRLAISDRSGTKLAVGIVDLDGFKPVNDSYGHRVGDRLLAEIARRLSRELPGAIEVFRVGGDEFAFLMTMDEDAPPEMLSAVGRDIIGTVERPFDFTDLRVSVSCSIGIAVYPDLATTADGIYEAADFALYRAKRSGRGRTEVYSQAHEAEISANGRIEQSLRVAAIDREFFPLFQPIVEAGSGRPRAFECLARWQSPVLGAVSPTEFIPVAERAGLVSSITLVILRKALSAMQDWPSNIGLSVNLSAVDITAPAMAARLVASVTESGIAPGRITFELTETALLQDFTAARANIETLRLAGLRVALDDFGTGYSSLSHVQSLPFDKLKIDRRFVHDIASNITSQSIIRSLVALCEGIGIDCVVEGTETEEQIATLRALGCDLMQGYFYARPMPASEVAGFVANPRAAAA